MDNENPEKKALRAQILSIQRDQTLDATTKQQKIQLLLKSSYKYQVKSESSEEISSELNTEKTFRKDDILGCSHYPRKCKLLAACCNQLYTCRLCHDEQVKSHQINRHATEKIFCMECSTLQPVAEVCIKCSVRFAKYFCSVCKFFDDSPDKEIFHCKDCGICRLGSLETVFHCEPCGVCMPTINREHKHIEKSLDSDCPICGENLFHSRNPTHYLPCAHPMHAKCFNAMIKRGGLGCPICKRSAADFTRLWEEYDRMLAQRKMPSVFERAEALVLCNDCDAKSNAPYHYMGSKCAPCGSYNTTITGYLNFPTQEEIMKWDEENRNSTPEAEQLDEEQLLEEMEAYLGNSEEEEEDDDDDEFEEEEDSESDLGQAEQSEERSPE